MKTKMLSVLALALCLAGCQRNNDDLEITKPGEPTGISLTIKMPHAPQTYASTDPNASDAEIAMKKVNVLIYRESSPGSGAFLLERNSVLSTADFAAVTGTPDTYVLKDDKKIVTSIGKKKIYVAMNYDGTFPATGSNVNELPNFVYTLSATGMLSANGIAMFSKAEVESILVKEGQPGYATSNTVTVTVKRMVAKITLQEDAGLRTAGNILCMDGKMVNLQFAVGNTNKTTYLFQKTGGSAPNIYVQDNNWSTFVAADFTDITNFSSTSPAYIPVDASTVNARTARAVYVPENTAEQYRSDGANLTYLSVRGQFIPAFFVNGSGVVSGSPPTSPVSFWTVTANGRIYYFNNVSYANTFRTGNPGSVRSDEYKDGFCYYRIYLNTKGVADATIAGSKANKFDVLRNMYHRLSILSISSPGSPTNVGEVTEETSLKVNISIEPWQTVTETHEL